MLLLPLLACARDGGQAAAAVARDSAGITIVENPLPAAAMARQLDSVAVLSIGGGVGGADYDLNEIRGAVRLTDGRIVVADNASGELRFFDSTGTLVTRTGRKGKGPGEFEQIFSLWAIGGDTLVAFDLSTRRLSFVAPTGAYVRQADLAQQGFMVPVGRLDDGTIVATGFSMNPTSLPSRGTIFRSPLPVLLVAADGGAPDTMAIFDGPEMYTEEISFAGRSFPTPMGLQFGRTTAVAAAGSRIYVADNAKPEIQVFGREGKLIRLVRLAYTPATVTDTMKKAQEAENLDRLTQNLGMPPAMVSQAQDMVRRAKYASQVPPYQAIVLARDGSLWVQEYTMPGGPLRFSVHDTTGSRVAITTLPEGVRPVDIGRDYVLGIWRDDDDVEHVRLYRAP
jgi:hypothetical protein